MDITLVGAGGVGAILAQHLIKTGHTVTVYDDDVYEEQNFARQPLARTYNGFAKVDALTVEATRMDLKLVPMRERYVGQPLITDVIIVAADNNQARIAARTTAIATTTPFISAANELTDGEAFLVMPEDWDTPNDPWVQYPELWQDTPPPTVHCDEGTEPAAPEQTPLANLTVATLAIRLVESIPHLTPHHPRAYKFTQWGIRHQALQPTTTP
jgi:hypothetical protein